jgi:hypothetical protein
MLSRLPAKQDVLLAYALIATIIFGWSFVAFLWKMPAWLLFLQPDEILTILAYTFSVNLLESLGFLCFLLLLSLLLPAGLLRDRFAVRGGFISLSVLGSIAIYLNRYVANGQGFVRTLPLWMLATILIAILLCIVSTRFSIVGSVVLWFADRLTVFLYIFVPLAALSLALVILRGIS